MIETINRALDEYQSQWDQAVSNCTNQAFFAELIPTSVGWKVEDEAAYRAVYNELRTQSTHTAETFMNERWIAKMRLGNTALHQGIEVIKVMQRRPESEDALGLDHVDFYCPNLVEAVEALGAEPSLDWRRGNNDIIEGYPWLSVWFKGADGNRIEAKLKDYTVFDIVRAEFAELSSRIIKSGQQ